MKNIKFYPKNKLVKEIIPPPKPNQVPEWYKKISLYKSVNGGKSDSFFVNNSMVNLSVKACVPFLDSMMAGYTISLWCDIQVRQEIIGPVLAWGHSETDLIPVVSTTNPEMPTYNGFDEFNFSWRTHWGIKTPEGYSCLFTHPINRYDLPFITTSGIMDTDKYGLWGNQPFAIQSGFEGIIPAGTPIVQVFPFKRESWKSSIDDSLSEPANYQQIKVKSKLRGYYKNNFWSRKKYQ